MKSRAGEVWAQGGTSVSRSKLHSSSWHVPHNEPDDPPSHGRCGARQRPWRLCCRGSSSRRTRSPSGAGYPGHQSRHPKRQDPREGTHSLCPLLLPQPVTAASLSAQPLPKPKCMQSAPHIPQRGRAHTLEMALPVPAGSHAVCPAGAAERLRRRRPPLPVCTLLRRRRPCLFMLGVTRVTMIVKRKKKKDACI